MSDTTLINDISINGNTELTTAAKLSETLQDNTINALGVDASSRTIWVNGQPYGNAYVNIKDGNTLEAPIGAEIFNDFVNNVASGEYSHASGLNTIASGEAEHVVGKYNDNSKPHQFSVGVGTSDNDRKNAFEVDSDGSSHFTGDIVIDGLGDADSGNNDALLENSIIVAGSGEGSGVMKGAGNSATGKNSLSIGKSCEAYGSYSFASGLRTKALNASSHAEGYNNESSGNCAHSEGSNNYAKADNAHVEGNDNLVEGHESHAEGIHNKVYGNASHAEGNGNRVLGDFSHVEGTASVAYSHGCHAEGYGCGAGDLNQKDILDPTLRTDSAAHAEGVRTIASGMGSHSEGLDTHASGIGSHAEGTGTYSRGSASHAEGISTKSGVKGYYIKGIDFKNKKIYLTTEQVTSVKISGFGSSDIENINIPYTLGVPLSIYNGKTYDGIIATSYKNNIIFVESLPFQKVVSITEEDIKPYDFTLYSVEEYKFGGVDLAYGSHSEGSGTRAFGYSSHASGIDSYASGIASHSSGFNTKSTNDYEFSVGKWNKSNDGTFFSIGIGEKGTAEEPDKNRKNAHEILQDGKQYIFNVGGYDGTNPTNSKDIATILSTVDTSDTTSFNVKSALNVNGATTLNGPVTLGNGDVDKIILKGVTTIDGTLGVTGTTTLHGTTIEGTLGVDEETTLKGGLKVNYIEAEGELNITGSDELLLNSVGESGYIRLSSRNSIDVSKSPSIKAQGYIVTDGSGNLIANASNKMLLADGSTKTLSAGSGLDLYEQICYVNGTKWKMAGTSNDNGFTIYAPTSAGNSGMILVSEGNPTIAPSWKKLTAGTNITISNQTISVVNAPTFSGNVYATAFYESSDATKKDIVSDIDIDFDKLSQIPKVNFNWKDDPEKKNNIGTIAQEIAKVYPEVVYGEEGNMTVDYAKLSIIALAAIDRLEERIKILENK